MKEDQSHQPLIQVPECVKMEAATSFFGGKTCHFGRIPLY